MERLLAAREPVYATADMVLESGDEPHAVLLDKIVAALAFAWDMRKRMSTRTVTVGLGERAYDIHVGGGLLSRAGELLKPPCAAPCRW